MERIKKFDILGAHISATNMGEVRDFINNVIKDSKKIYISTCPVNTIMDCQDNREAMQSINAADLAVPDGMPVAWIGKIKGFRNIGKVSGTDLMLEICKLSEKKGFKNYFYGSTPQALASLKRQLKISFPALAIAGMHSPVFYGPVQEDRIAGDIGNINKSDTDVLWIGLGSPKQDIWMFKYRGKLNVPVIIGVGAAFDFISSLKKRAPIWMQRSGLEWLFRFLQEPKRLWRRYLINNTLFILFILKDLTLKPNSEKAF